MADSIEQVLVDVGFQSSKNKDGLKQIYAVMDERDKKEAELDEQQKEQTKQMLKDADSAIEKQEQLLDLKKKQTEEEKKRIDQAARGGGGGGGGFFGGGGGGGAGGEGGGLGIGGVIAGVAGGEAIFELLKKGAEGLAEVFEKSVDWMREALEETGRMQNMLLSFDALTKQLGVDSEEYLGEAKDATHGLVEEHELLASMNKTLSINTGLAKDQIIDLYKGATDLARAEGKEVAPAIETVNRAVSTGRLNMLAYHLELSATAKARLADLEGMDAQRKAQEQFKITIEEINKALERRGGAPPINYEESVKQLETAAHGFQEQVGLALVNSNTFKQIIEGLNVAIQFIKENGPAAAKAIGNLVDELVGPTLLVGKQILDGIVSALKLIKEAASAAASAIKTLSAGILDIDLSGSSGKVGLFKTIMIGLAEAIATVNTGLAQFALRLVYIKDIATLGLSAATDKFEKSYEETTKKWYDKMEDLDAQLHPKAAEQKKEGEKKKEEVLPPDEDPSAVKRTKEAQLALEKARLDAEYELNKIAIDKRKELAQDQFKNHQITLQQELDIEKKAADDLLALDLKKINAEAAMEKQKLDVAGKTMSGLVKQEGEYAAKVATLDQQTALKRTKAYEQYRKTLHDEAGKGIDDERKAAEVRETTEIQVTTKIREEEAKLRDERFKKGELAPKDYINAQLADVEAEKNAAIDLAKLKFKYASDTKAAEQQLLDATVIAEQDAADRRLEIEAHRIQTMNDYAESQYKKNLSLLQSKEGAPGTNKNAVLDQEKVLVQDRVHELMTELFTLKEGTDEYIKRQQLLNQTLSTLTAITNKQIALRDAAAGTVKIFADAFGKFEALKGIGTSLGNTVDILNAQTSYRRESAAAGLKGPAAENAFKGMFEAIRKPADAEQKTSVERLQQFNSALKSAATQVVSFISAFTSAQTGTQGAVGGGFATLGLVGTLSQFKGLGALAGPAGIAISAVGAAVGFFVGRAKEQTVKLADGMVKAFKGVSDALANGSTSLKNALADMEKQRQKTVQELSGRKGGREQLDKILPGMDQQIAALKKQQDDLNDSLQKELEILRAPEAFRGTIRDLDSIIAKYKEYAGATNDVAAAQEYLTRSVEDYVDSQGKDLSKAQQQAIQDAVDLNDLLQQRQNILEQAATSEYDVLTQGVLTRQRTVAQTKAAQIEEIRKQRDMQLEQINKQIDLAKVRVDAEQTIFNLATDRVTLETQLLQMQKQSIMDDMARLATLSGLVASLKNGQATPDQIQGWINQLTGVGAGNSLAKAAEAQYANAGRMGYGGYNGEL